MSDRTRVLFNKPIEEEIKPVRGGPASGRPTSLPFNQIQNLCRALRETGWNERSVVAKRSFYPHGAPNDYEMCQPVSWGVVTDLRVTAMPMTSEPYLPLTVRWVKDGSISKHWPEELVLIHKAMPWSELAKDIKEQINDKPVGVV